MSARLRLAPPSGVPICGSPISGCALKFHANVGLHVGLGAAEVGEIADNAGELPPGSGVAQIVAGIRRGQIGPRRFEACAISEHAATASPFDPLALYHRSQAAAKPKCGLVQSFGQKERIHHERVIRPCVIHVIRPKSKGIAIRSWLLSGSDRMNNDHAISGPARRRR